MTYNKIGFSEIKDIIENNSIGYLSIVNSDNTPYIMQMIYANSLQCNELNFYLITNNNDCSNIINNLSCNNNVSFLIEERYVSNIQNAFRLTYLSVLAIGKAKIVKDICDKERIYNCIYNTSCENKRYIDKYIDSNNYSIIEIYIERISGNKYSF